MAIDYLSRTYQWSRTIA